MKNNFSSISRAMCSFFSNRQQLLYGTTLLNIYYSDWEKPSTAVDKDLSRDIQKCQELNLVSFTHKAALLLNPSH